MALRTLSAARRAVAASVAGGIVLLGTSLVLAQTAQTPPTGQPLPWQIGMQDPVTPVAQTINDFNTLLMWVMGAVTVFVMALLLYVMVRFNAKANPTPAHFHHNTFLEVAWTVIPILILVVISIPSFKNLYYQYSFPKPDVTIKAIGHQWYWSYEYVDHEGLTFDSNMLKAVEDKDQIAALNAQGFDTPRLLAVDNEIIVPVNKVVHMLITSQDVIHNWTIPAFGVKTDAVPGRVMANWFQATKPGVYYGVCSELCGERHAFMPIAVRVLSQEGFDKFIAVRKAGGPGVDQKVRELTRAAELEMAKVPKMANAE
jgi:cytochrome c oxidase subunit II